MSYYNIILIPEGKHFALGNHIWNQLAHTRARAEKFNPHCAFADELMKYRISYFSGRDELNIMHQIIQTF